MAISVELTNSNIEKLLAIRKIIDKYLLLFSNDSDNPNLMTQCVFELASYGFTSLKQAKEFNIAMNVLEFDRIYVARPVGKESIEDNGDITIDDFCINGSYCLNRNIPICTFDLKFVSCVKLERIFEKVLPMNESKMGKEVIAKAAELGITDPGLYAPHPFMSIAMHTAFPETHCPEFCVCKCIKIDEPRFDLTWGMERMFSAGEIQKEYRRRIMQ